MAEKVSSPTVVVDDTSFHESKTGNEVIVDSVSSEDGSPSASGPIAVPLKWKLASILMVSAIGFGSNWSSGITGAMKTTIKKQMKINNTQYALLDASEDFMKTVLILASGLVTDRIGGAGKKPPLKLPLRLNKILTKNNRSNSLWKPNFHSRVYHRRCVCSNTHLQSNDIWKGRASSGRYLHPSGPVQNIFFLVPSQPWIRIDPRSRTRNRKNRFFCWEIERQYNFQKHREFRKRILGCCGHEFIYQPYDNWVLHFHAICQ